MAVISITLKGLDELQKNLERIGDRMLHEVGRALYEEAEVEKLESMRKTPVDTGALRGSHTVSQPDHSRNNISVKIGVGGPAAPYAEAVHENLEALHKVGQAKFLESTVRESAPHLAARIARRVRANLG